MKALLEPTILTPISLCFVDFTISVSYTIIYALVLHCPLEEAFAPARQSVKIDRLKWSMCTSFFTLHIQGCL